MSYLGKREPDIADLARVSVGSLIDSRPDLFLLRNGRPLWQKRHKRRRREKVDLENGEWGRLINNHAIWNPESFEAKKFRSRFRMPWILFIKSFVPGLGTVYFDS
mmetsp:Transcript_25562/g.37763  ORF Transcript_25562/g.37763 Transcript_25562/m.37763 type:complete len:105 (-) Transcript_25562:213-527(-)